MTFTIPTNVVTVEPKVEPIGPEDVKANAYVVDTEEDNKFITDQLIPTARRYVEELAKRSLITQTRKQSYDCMPCSPFFLRYSPVQSTTITFTYVDTNGTTQTLASTEYNVDILRIPGRVEEAYGKAWPSAREQANSVNITYTAGYGAAAKSVPIIYRRCMIVLCTHWYDNRDQLGCVGEDMAGKLEGMLAIEGRTLEYA